MGQYYYTVATLPMLFFESDNYPTIEDFLEPCSRLMSRKDYELLVSAELLPDPTDLSSNPLLRKWYELEIALRNELARQRAAQLNREEQSYVRGVEDGEDLSGTLGLPEVAREALTQESPLKAEMVLLRHRWGILDELEVTHHFDVEKLIIYYLKLQILWRKRNFNREDGTNVFERTYNTVRRAVSSS
ncbi:MAG: DUF2764 family protein [Spirochaetota bacterium]